MKKPRNRILGFCAGCGKAIKARGFFEAGDLYCRKGCAEASRMATAVRTWLFAEPRQLSGVPHHD